jgi:hypothetical protein
LHNLIRIPRGKNRSDWNGTVNIYNQKGEFVDQADTLIDAAEWVWKNTKHKLSVADFIGRACKENMTAYGFKFQRIKNKESPEQSSGVLKISP